MNHTNYTSETIRLDPSSSGTKENEKNVLLQSLSANSNNGNHQKKKVSSFQITSIRPTSRSSNDADLADDSENDTEDTSDILDSSKLTTDIEPETQSCSEEYSKSEEVFVGASPIINTSQYGISTLIHPSSEDVIMTAHLPQGVTVNVTEGGLALAKANGGIDDLNNWQKRFKIVKISSNEKFRRGRWVCFDFNDSPAVSASESKSEGIQNSAENTVIIPTSDPNMPGFLQVPVPIFSVELAQPLAPIAVQYPTGEPIVQGTIPMTSNITFAESDQNSDTVSDQPHFFQPSAQYIYNYGTHETNSQSYSQAHNSSATQTSHSRMSSQSCLPSTGNIPKDVIPNLQLASNSVTNIPTQPDNSIPQASVSSSAVLTTSIISHNITQASSDSNYSQASSSNQSDNSNNNIAAAPSIHSQLHPQPVLSTVCHPGSHINQQIPGAHVNIQNVNALPNQSCNIAANNPAQSSAVTTSIVTSIPTILPGHNITQTTVFSQAELEKSQGNVSNIGSSDISALQAQGQSSISMAQLLQAQGIGVRFSQPSSSQVLSVLEAVANKNIDSISSNSSVLMQGDDNESSSTSTVAIDNKIEQAMDLVKSHLMFAVREEVEVLKEKILELMDQIGNLERENSILRQYAPPDALQQIQQSKPQSGASAPGSQITHHGGSS